jgi:hypothetical protein
VSGKYSASCYRAAKSAPVSCKEFPVKAVPLCDKKRLEMKIEGRRRPDGSARRLPGVCNGDILLFAGWPSSRTENVINWKMLI